MCKRAAFAARFRLKGVFRLEAFYLWGTITRPQGIKGGMKVDTDLADPGFLAAIKCAYLKKEGAFLPFPIREITRRNTDVFILCGDITTRNGAEEMRGQALYLSRKDNPLPKNVDLVCDLIGCTVVDLATAEPMGTLEKILHLPAQDVYFIRSQDREYYVPALLSVFPKTDPESKTIYADGGRFRETALLQE